MNKDKKILFILEHLYKNSEIPVYIYNEKDALECVYKGTDQINLFDCDQMFLEKLKNSLKDDQTVLLFIETVSICWGIMRYHEEGVVILGPLFLKDMNNNLFNYRHIHNINNQDYKVTIGSMDTLSNLLSMLAAIYYDIYIEEYEIPYFWNINKQDINLPQISEKEEYKLEKTEDGRMSTSAAFEENYVKIVELGDVNSMKKMIQINTREYDRVGEVAANSIKKMEYLCIASIILVSRAAIRGGMNVAEAYDLSDIYMQKIEKCANSEEMGYVCSNMQLEFTERVHETKLLVRGNLLVQQAKDYIANHLRKPFQISRMADEMHVSRTYLSRIFSQQENITIHQYIIKERCEHAANMLKYTNYSLSIIAEYFCFSNQSHFGKKFKEIYGISPNEYRRRNYITGEFN